MKKFITFGTAFLLFFSVLSCKKDRIEPDISKPDPVDTTDQRNFKLVFDHLKDHLTGSEKLTAHVIVANPQQPEKQIHLAVQVLIENQCTPVVKLPKGSYQIQRLIINDESGTTRFATPVAGSARASQVTKPLSVSLVLEQKADQEVRLEVLPVGSMDLLQQFGYPDGTFGKNPIDPQPPMDKRVFIRVQVKVGEVLYDSIPAQLILRSWDAKDEMDYKMFSVAGTQAIYLPAKAVRFQLTVNKWGSRVERTLTQAEVKENALYIIDVPLEAKKLKSVVDVKITDVSSRPQTKTDYEYDARGEISQRVIWGKRADNSNYIIQKDLFSYVNGNITSIKSYDENNVLLKTLTARYDNDGRVIALDEVKGSEKMSVTASYLPLETGGNIKDNYRIDAQYKLENGKYTDYYSKTMSGGRMIYDIYVSHSDGNEECYYDYDAGINPYVHLKIPDLLFTQYDRHNKVFSRKHYGRGRPEHEPYDFKYTYDADGYPKELLTKYRSTGSKMDAYTIRTIFTY